MTKIVGVWHFVANSRTLGYEDGRQVVVGKIMDGMYANSTSKN